MRFWLQKVFLSTPSARRATLAACAALHADAISIHALREEGDTVPSSETTSVEDFYPRPPRGGRLQPVFQGENCCLNFYPRPPRGGRLCPVWPRRGEWRFLSTPSARRATSTYRFDSGKVFNFYPRPPRGGRRAEAAKNRAWQISIHALREEGDERPKPQSGMDENFYPRPPRGGRHHRPYSQYLQQNISIHALREEGDQSPLRC